MTEIDSESEKTVLDKSKDNTQPTTSKGGNVIFPWCDASTKIFLKEYKEKRELVRTRKLKNMKNAYQEMKRQTVSECQLLSILDIQSIFNRASKKQ